MYFCLYSKASVHDTGYGFCAGTKIIPDKASVHTQERLWGRAFCDEAKVRRADL